MRGRNVGFLLPGSHDEFNLQTLNAMLLPDHPVSEHRSAMSWQKLWRLCLGTASASAGISRSRYTFWRATPAARER
jgi:hypothetical protein